MYTQKGYYVEFKRTVNRISKWFTNGPYRTRKDAIDEVNYLHRIGFNARLQGE